MNGARDSGTEVPHAGAATSLVEMLAHHASTHPDADAVVGPGRTLTTRDLWRHSTALGRRLRELGVGADDCVGVCADPSAELMVAVWGALTAGSAYLPLSPEYPRDRLRYMVTDSGTRVVVTTPGLAAQVRETTPHGVHVVELDLTAPAPDGPAPDAPAPTSLAYVVYTSGSTGRPKGVMIEHRSIASQMRWMHDHAGIRRGERVLQKTPFSFDAAQWEILAPAVGATVVVASPGAYRDPERLVDAVVEHGVTVLQCVPTLWTALLDSERLPECTSLRRIFAGGEVLTSALARGLDRALPHALLTNLYGPTETTINATAQDVTRAVLLSVEPTVPIGQAVTDTDLLVLDAEQRTVDAGEVGELHIGGIQVARGYVNNAELTAARFVDWHGGPGSARRLYRTGDLARRDAAGELAFVGRADNQVKINGHRIELDEVKVAIEDHHWVRQSCVVPWTSPRTGATQLAAFVELDPREAALMDQGAHGSHHESKQSRVQVKAQLAQNGLPGAEDLAGRASVDLPGRDATEEQADAVFARKTYRFYDGGPTRLGDLLAWLTPQASAPAAPAAEIDVETLGAVLRWLGPFTSPERLLPKYLYASPGALYATQVHVEATGVAGLEPGLYYVHPVEHRLVLEAPRPATDAPRVRVHLVGRPAAIEAVYSTNVREVLAFEAGHMAGALDAVLPRFGLALHPVDDVLDVAELPLPGEHVALASFALAAGPGPTGTEGVRMFLQPHDVDGLVDGLHEVTPDGLVRVADETVARRYVIAINQAVHDRSAFGITLALPRAAGWAGFVALGRALQHLESNEAGFGLMSSGYSSLTGRDLASARRFESIMGTDAADPAWLTYFAVGGRISAGQRRSRGMAEDVVHMRGPAEILKDALKEFLPQFMVPARVDVVASLPKTANGKCDAVALTELARAADAAREIVGPRTDAERTVARLWTGLLGGTDVSMTDDFFGSGGNSLAGVTLINRINRTFGAALPMQTLFLAPTPELLAAAAVEHAGRGSSRLVPLQPDGAQRPVYCWPGLGGFPMNLRELATALGTERPVYGVQAHGLNPDEIPFATIEEMARADVAMILERQPAGPYTLLGYSFGARVAFEAAHQLEDAGHEVDRVVLVAPGSPLLADDVPPSDAEGADFADPRFVQILLSVFTGSLESPLWDRCRGEALDEAAFCALVHAHLDHLDPGLIARIVTVVRQTFSFTYTFAELDSRVVAAPLSVLKATGDDYSFIEGRAGFSLAAPEVVELDHDHYSVLHGRAAVLLAGEIHRHLAPVRKGTPVPHINIKHFPVDLTDEDRRVLVEQLSATVSRTFGCADGAVSIALEPIAESDWTHRVLRPELIGRRDLLCKTPDYAV